MGKCKFDVNWLSKRDSLGYNVSDWCAKKSELEFFCKVCVDAYTCQKGWYSLAQHVGTSRHQANAKEKIGPLQLHLAGSAQTAKQSADGTQTQPEPSTSVGSATEVTQVETNEESVLDDKKTLIMFSKKDESVKAEILWALHTVVHDESAASCEGIADTFKAMFPCNASDKFSMGRTKVAYIITEALHPFFRDSLLRDVKSSLYTVHYDETTNTKNMKELQVRVRFWHTERQEVQCHHLETFFIGQATGDILHEYILKAVDNAGLSLQNMLMLSSDGPNVNKKVWRLVNEAVKTSRSGKSLIDIGTCNIHIMHNAFLKGLQEHGQIVSDVIIKIYYFFEGWPTRNEAYEAVQKQMGVPLHAFIKHVPSRWLTLLPAANRIVEQWSAITEYILSLCC